MDKLYEIIEKLTSVPGVSGFEHAAFAAVREFLASTEIFDEIYTTPVSSICALMRCGKKNAPLVMCDAHLDTSAFLLPRSARAVSCAWLPWAASRRRYFRRAL